MATDNIEGTTSWHAPNKQPWVSDQPGLPVKSHGAPAISEVAPAIPEVAPTTPAEIAPGSPNDMTKDQMIQCLIYSTIAFAIGLTLLLLYCPWSSCPCVKIAFGMYNASTVQHTAGGYVVKYQYYIPEYNTTDCFRTDNSRKYQTVQFAEQNAIYSDYVNFTSFYYDTRFGKCYDIGDGVLSLASGFLIFEVVISGLCVLSSLSSLFTHVTGIVIQ